MKATDPRIDAFCATHGIDKALAPDIQAYVLTGESQGNLCAILDKQPTSEQDEAIVHALLGERAAFEQRSSEHENSLDLAAFYADHDIAARFFAEDMLGEVDGDREGEKFVINEDEE